MEEEKAGKVAVATVKHAVTKTDFGWIMRRSAALAYYGALSLAPLVIVALAVASMIWDREALRSGLLAEMTRLVGPTGGALIASILENSNDAKEGIVAAIVGVATLVFGATAVFVELQDGLNAIWDVEPTRGKGIWKFIRTRLVSIAMVVSTGFLLLVSLVVSAVLAAFTKSLGLGDVAAVGMVLQFLVAVIVTGLMFGALFKFVPDVRSTWREVWVGALITAVLFNLGQLAIGAYLGRTSVGSAYGAAGSLVIVLVWL